MGIQSVKLCDEIGSILLKFWAKKLFSPNYGSMLYRIHVCALPMKIGHIYDVSVEKKFKNPQFSVFSQIWLKFSHFAPYSKFKNDRNQILVPKNIYWGLSCKLWIILDLSTKVQWEFDRKICDEIHWSSVTNDQKFLSCCDFKLVCPNCMTQVSKSREMSKVLTVKPFKTIHFILEMEFCKMYRKIK